MNESLIFCRIPYLLDCQTRPEPKHINPQLCVCMFIFHKSCHRVVFTLIIWVWSVQLCASVTCWYVRLRCAHSCSHCAPVCVVSPRANEAELQFNLRREGIISFLVVMEMRCLSLTQWIVESDALMVWEENSLTYIQAGAESWELKLFDFMPCFFLFSFFFLPHHVGFSAVNEWFVRFTWCVAFECVCGVVGVFVFICHVIESTSATVYYLIN